MGWTEVWQYSKLVKCPLENQYFASYIAIAAIYFERICTFDHDFVIKFSHFFLDSQSQFEEHQFSFITNENSSMILIVI